MLVMFTILLSAIVGNKSQVFELFFLLFAVFSFMNECVALT